MYYKHDDDLKDKIAHGINESQSLQNNNMTTLKQFTPQKAKKLTPTQIRKLARMKLEEETATEKKEIQN